MTPSEAHSYAISHNIDPGFDIKRYQEIACKDPQLAYAFALDIPGADIEYCQAHACKDHDYAYIFALIIPGANVNICKKTIS